MGIFCDVRKCRYLDVIYIDLISYYVRYLFTTGIFFEFWRKEELAKTFHEKNDHFEVPYMAKHNIDNRTTLPNFPNDCFNLLDNLT